MLLRDRAVETVLNSGLQHSQPLEEVLNPRPVIPDGFERICPPFSSALRPGSWGFTICFVPSVLGPAPGVQAGLSLEERGRGHRVRRVREACRGDRMSLSLSCHTHLCPEKGRDKRLRETEQRETQRQPKRAREKGSQRRERGDAPWAY